VEGQVGAHGQGSPAAGGVGVYTDEDGGGVAGGELDQTQAHEAESRDGHAVARHDSGPGQRLFQAGYGFAQGVGGFDAVGDRQDRVRVHDGVGREAVAA